MQRWDDEWEVVDGPVADEWEVVAGPGAGAAPGTGPGAARVEPDLPEVVRDSFRVSPLPDPDSRPAGLPGLPPPAGVTQNVTASVESAPPPPAPAPMRAGPGAFPERSLRARTLDDITARSPDQFRADEARERWAQEPAGQKALWALTRGSLLEKVKFAAVEGLDKLLFGNGFLGTGLGKGVTERGALGAARGEALADSQKLRDALDLGLADAKSPAVRLAQQVTSFTLGGDAAAMAIMKKPMVAFPALRLADQVLSGRGVNERELGEAVVEGLVFQAIPMPKALTKAEGGLVKRLGRQFGQVGLRTAQIMGVRAGFAAAAGEPMPSGQDVLDSAAFMLALHLPQIAFNVQAGAVTDGLKRAGIPEGKSSQIANAYVSGTISKRDLAKAKVMVPHLEKVGLERDLAVKVLDQTLQGQPRLGAIWTQMRDELQRMGAAGGLEPSMAREAANMAVRTYWPKIGGLPEIAKLLRSREARQEFVRRAEAWVNKQRPRLGAEAGPGPAPAAEPWMGMLDGTTLRDVFADDSPVALLGRHVSRPGRQGKGAAAPAAGRVSGADVPQSFESSDQGRQAAREYLVKALTGYGLDQAAAGRIAARSEPVPGWRPEDLANLPAAELDGMLRAAVDAPARVGPRAEPNLDRADAPPAAAIQPDLAVENRDGAPPMGTPAPVAPAEKWALPPLEKPARVDVAEAAQVWDAETPLDPDKLASGRWGWMYLDDEGVSEALSPRAAMVLGIQDRDRTRKASDEARLKRLQKFSARRLVESITSNIGSPIVHQTGRVLAGYGRFGTYEDVWALPVSDKRRQSLVELLESKGAELTGARPDMARRPVLVRVADNFSEATDPKDFAKRSNEREIQGFSDAENALRDARMIEATPGMLELLDPDESGNLLAASNKAFYSKFLGGLDDATEMVGAGGKPSPALERRMQNAILGAVLKEHPDAVDTVALLLEQADEIGAVRAVKGLTASAPGLLKFKGTPYDVIAEVAWAVSKLNQLKMDLAAGRWKSVDEALAQRDMFDEITPTEKAILKLLVEAKSVEEIRGVLDNYSGIAGQIDTKTPDMFGGEIPDAEKGQVLARAVEKWEVEYASRKAERKSARDAAKGQDAGGGPGALEQAAQPGGAGPAGGPGAGGLPAGAAGAPGAASAAPAVKPPVVDAAEADDILAAAFEDLDALVEDQAQGAAPGTGPGRRLEPDQGFVLPERPPEQVNESRGPAYGGPPRPLDGEKDLFEVPFNLVGGDARAQMQEIEAAKKRREALYAEPGALEKQQQALFEQAAVFAEQQGVVDEKQVFKLSNEYAEQLALPGLDVPYPGGRGAGDGGAVPGAGKGGGGAVARQAAATAGKGKKPDQIDLELQKRALEALGKLAPDPVLLRQALADGGGRISALIHGLLNRDIPSFKIEGQVISTPGDFARLSLACRSRLFEIFKGAIIDRLTRKIVYSNVLSAGVRNGTLIDPQTIFNMVAQAQRVSGLPLDRLRVLTVHNHPGGDPKPSPEDVLIVRKLTAACDAAGVGHEDHLSTDGDSYYSHTDQTIYRFDDNTLLPSDLVAIESQPKMIGSGQWAGLAGALRQANPNTISLILLNTQRRILEVRQYNVQTFPSDLLREMVLDSARVSAAAVMLALPDEAERSGFVLRLQETLRLAHVHLLDVNSPETASWREFGKDPDLFVKENEAAPYAVREAAAAGGQQQRLIEAGARAVAAWAQKNGLEPSAELVGQVLGRYGQQFRGLEGQVLDVARQIAAPELKLFKDMKRGEKDEQGEKDQTRPVEESQKAARGRGGRTDIRIASRDALPTPPAVVPAGRWKIDADQELGVNLALDRFLNQGGKGFLLADGTGVGKTRQILVTAKEVMERTGKRVLIIVPKVGIVQGSYMDDAEDLGIDLADFDIGTYASIRGGREGLAKVLRGLTREKEGTREVIDLDDPYGLVVCDEAHNLKNLAAQQTQMVLNIIAKADHSLLATATPMDTPMGACYFLAEITGVDRQRMARMLGFEIKRKLNHQTGEYYEVPVLLPKMSWSAVKKNLVNLRDAAVKQGGMVRREYPFIGTFESMDIQLPPEQAAEYKRIEKYFDMLILIAPGGAKKTWRQQKTHALSNWLEPRKVPMVIERAMQSMQEGRRVIICCQHTSPSDRLRRPEPKSRFAEKAGELWDAVLGQKPEIPGAAEQVCAELEARGITVARCFGRGPKGPAVAEFQAGEKQALVMTATSGGAGINADDVKGNEPRDLYRLVMEYAGDVDQQTIGRINRRNTVDPEKQRVIDVYLPGAFSDERRREINFRKQEILRRIQDGADIDLAGFDPAGDEPKADEPAGGLAEDGAAGPGLSGPGVLEEALALAEDMDRAADVGAAWPGGPLGTPKAAGSPPLTVDDPNFSALPIEMPELVQFGRALLDGKYPVIRQKLGHFMGRFRHTVGPVAAPEGDIALLAKIFRLVTPEEEARLLEEAQAWTAANAAPGDNIPLIVRERFEHLYDEAFRAAKKKNPLLASKVLAHEIGHVVDWIPTGYTEGKGNILAHLANFVNYSKKQLAELPADQWNLLTDKDRAEIRKQAQKEGKSDKAAVNEAYRRLINAEMKRRGLVRYEDVMEELEPVVAWWRGSGDKMEKYFKPPHEMYAEVLSVLLNNPEALRARAPLFWKLWQNWLLNKPGIRKRYDALQDAINSGQIYKDRVETMYREMAAADQAAADLDVARADRTPREIADAWIYTVDRRFGPIQRRLGTIADHTTRREALTAISDSLYRGAAAELIMSRVSMEVVPLLENAQFQWINLGEYMLHQRIFQGDRANLGNPWGMTPKASAERLAEMRREYGERFAALEEAALWLRTIYEEEVLAPAREFGTFGPDLQDMIEDNVFYATFAVTRGQIDPGMSSFQVALEHRFGGSATGSGIFKQFGTLKPVKNPATATLQKMVAISSFIRREHAKAAAVQALLGTEYADEWRPAEMVWTGKRREIRQVNNERIGTLVYMQGGKLHGYYGPRALVDAFKTGDALEISTMARFVATANNKLKGLYTAINPGFWPVGLWRDVRAANIQLPGMARNPWNYVPVTGGVTPYLGRAFRSASSSIAGRPDDSARAALRRGMVISRGAGYWGQDQDDEIDRMLQQRGLPAMRAEAQGALHRVLNWWQNDWSAKGQVAERAIKIAGMMYLDDHFANMPETWKRMNVRAFAGSPDFLERGALNWAVDAGALFFNPAKEGWRSNKRFLLGSGEEPGRPGEWAWQTMRWTVIPRVIQTMLATGALASLARYLTDQEEDGRLVGGLRNLSEMYQDGPSGVESLGYSILPLGWADRSEHKVLYFRMPYGDQERAVSAGVGALVQAALAGRTEDIAPILTGFVGREMPGVSPLLSIGAAVGGYALGRNPYDNYMQRNIMTDTEQDARSERPWPARRAMGRYVWNQIFGSLVGRIPPPDRPNDRPTTMIERVLRAPGVQPTLGRWLRVSNAGYRERMERATQDVETRQAVIRMDIEAGLLEYQRTGALPPAVETRAIQGAALVHRFKDAPLTAELELQRYYYTHLMSAMQAAGKGQAPLDMRMLMGQPTRAGRSALMEQMLEDGR